MFLLLPTDTNHHFTNNLSGIKTISVFNVFYYQLTLTNILLIFTNFTNFKMLTILIFLHEMPREALYINNNNNKKSLKFFQKMYK